MNHRNTMTCFYYTPFTLTRLVRPPTQEGDIMFQAYMPNLGHALGRGLVVGHDDKANGISHDHIFD